MPTWATDLLGVALILTGAVLGVVTALCGLRHLGGGPRG